MSLARSNIEFYWRQTFTTVFILAFVGLLIFHQVGGVVGQWRTLGVVEREVTADLVIGAASSANRPMNPLGPRTPPGVRPLTLTHPNVAYIEGYQHWGGRASYRGLTTDRPRLIDLDLSERSLMFPRSVPPETRELLARSGVVAVNQSFANRFDVKLGDVETIDDELVQIVAILNVYEGLGAIILRGPSMSVSTGPSMQQVESVLQRELGVSFGFSDDRGLLLKLQDPSIVEETAAELRTLLPRSVRVLSPEQLITATGLAQLANDRRIRSFLVTAAFTVLICAIIAAQTLRGAILTHRDQYGALMALGISRWRLVRTAMETALWIGVLSSVLAVSGGFVMAGILDALGTNFALTFEVVAATLALLMIISFIAGLASLGALMRVSPAALLR
ncbi:MAG: ABC transporter permease [Pseudomonadota bacterium]